MISLGKRYDICKFVVLCGVEVLYRGREVPRMLLLGFTQEKHVKATHENIIRLESLGTDTVKLLIEADL